MTLDSYRLYHLKQGDLEEEEEKPRRWKEGRKERWKKEKKKTSERTRAIKKCNRRSHAASQSFHARLFAFIRLNVGFVHP